MPLHTREVSEKERDLVKGLTLLPPMKLDKISTKLIPLPKAAYNHLSARGRARRS